MTDSFKFHTAPNPGPTLLSEIKKQCPNVFLIMFRSKNDNVVVYEANINERGVLDKKKPIDIYWLDIDKAYRDPKRIHGILSDRVELSLLENTFVYGINIVYLKENGKGLKMKMKHFDQEFTLQIDSKNKPKLFTKYKDKQCYILSGFASASESFTINPLALINNLKSLEFRGLETKTKKAINVVIK